MTRGILLFEKYPQLVRRKPLLLFFCAFTAGFYLFAVTLKFTFPFLAGFLLALLAQPMIRWLKKRLRLPRAAAAAVATMLVYAVIFGLLFLLGYWLVGEISNLIVYVSELSKANLSGMTGPFNEIVNQIGSSFKKVDSDFVQQNREQIVGMIQSGAGTAKQIFSAILGFLTSLPAIITMFIVMIFSTYFFSKDMISIKGYILSLFSDETAGSIRSFSRTGLNFSGRYICSYLLIYFITFLETLVVFYALGVPYPLVLSLVTGIADVLPVLGPGIVYIPLALIYLVQADFFHAAALLVCWLLISAIRQVIEPKIVSSSIHIHPLTMLAALYFALMANNFWLLIYFSVLIICYKILTQAGALPHLLSGEKTVPPAEAPGKKERKSRKP
jgi:sporulation integral membrane protein YtvI